MGFHLKEKGDKNRISKQIKQFLASLAMKYPAKFRCSVGLIGKCPTVRDMKPFVELDTELRSIGAFRASG